MPPFTCRKAGQSALLRKLTVPFEPSDYVAVAEIGAANDVVLASVPHQLEDDYCRGSISGFSKA